MQGTHLAFEFHLSFQKLRAYQLIDSFSLLAEFFRGFFVLFFYWLDEYTWILLQLLNKGVITLYWLSKSEMLSSGFWKASRAYKEHFTKEERGPLAFFGNSNEFQKLNASPA